ncbi:MAG: CapA family protein [Oscillospiraceae bacterium]|nr:CapA family protein [Oscillospiraceae bacterium]
MKILTVGLAALLVGLLVLSAYLPGLLKPDVNPQLSTRPTESIPTEPSVPTQPSTPTEPTEITEPTESTEATEPTAKPEGESFLISFAGDCTFATNHNATPSWDLFPNVVGDNYDYPFAGVKPYFDADDLTIVNLECALTTYDPTEEEMKLLQLDTKSFRFRGPLEYVNILTRGSVEVASVANNHARDYAEPGWKETLEVLKNAGVRYATWGSNALITTENGLTVGIYANNSWVTESGMVSNIKKLRQQGADVVIVSLHWGDERHYAPNEYQQKLGRLAVDSGADIVFGHHPHVLQPLEFYNGGLIMYSMGNFSFGGNRNPSDKDTVVVQQEFVRTADGSVVLGETILIPCRISSITNRNDYQPTPYDPTDPGYLRVLSKLDGSYAQQWLEQQAEKNPAT